MTLLEKHPELFQFPQELRNLNQWVCYRLETRDDKTTKPPYVADGSSRLADKTNPADWRSFTEATSQDAAVYSGAGFCLALGGGVTFLDLDHCVDPVSGEIADWALQLTREFPSYWETSPSQNGLHCWCWGTIPDNGKSGSLEMYGSGAYGTVTGLHLPSSPLTLASLELLPLHMRMRGGEFRIPDVSVSPLLSSVEPSTGRVTDNRTLLQEGRWEECQSPRYPSPSEADYALLSFLAQELSTEEEIDAAARATGMLRPKWDEPRGETTYLRYEIRKLLASKGKVAAPPITVHGPADIPDPREIESAPIKFLVDGLIPAEQVTLIAGAPGVGKSWLAMMLCTALLRGEDFLGRDVIRTENIVYCDRENPLAVIKERMQSLFRDEEMSFKHWGLWLEDQPPDFSSSRYLDFAKGAVLVFDSFTRFHGSKENDNSEMARVMAYLRRLQARGATVLCLHHRDKKMEAGYRGATEILAGCDTLYSLSREPQADLLTLRLIKSRSALDSEITFRCDWDAPSMTATENTKVTRRRDHCDLISAILRSSQDPVQQSVIVERMAAQGVSGTATRRYLDAMEGSLWISRGAGRGFPKTYQERLKFR
jgi:hypothetical protein